MQHAVVANDEGKLCISVEHPLVVFTSPTVPLCSSLQFGVPEAVGRRSGMHRGTTPMPYGADLGSHPGSNQEPTRSVEPGGVVSGSF